MVEKVFKVVSNSEELLNAEIIALSLLRQVTLSPAEPVAVFGVEQMQDNQGNRTEKA